MKKGSEQVVVVVGWMIGGFVFSILALFSIFGGFILALLMLVATPFVMGFLIVEAIFGKQPQYVTSAVTEEPPMAAPLLPELEHPVLVEVTRVNGMCATGYPLAVGDRWVVNGKVEGTLPLCPAAYEMLKQYAGPLHAEVEESPKLVRCANGHMVEFEVSELSLEGARPLAIAHR